MSLVMSQTDSAFAAQESDLGPERVPNVTGVGIKGLKFSTSHGVDVCFVRVDRTSSCLGGDGGAGLLLVDV